MVNNHKVRLLMEALREGKPLAAAAAKAGMSENTARKWRDSEILPGEVRQERLWRSREDPFREVWDEEEHIDLIKALMKLIQDL